MASICLSLLIVSNLLALARTTVERRRHGSALPMPLRTPRAIFKPRSDRISGRDIDRSSAKEMVNDPSCAMLPLPPHRRNTGGLKSRICFESCNPSCASDAREGNVYLSCLSGVCSPGVAHRGRFKSVQAAMTFDKLPAGIDRFPDGRTLTLPDSSVLRRGIVLRLDRTKSRRVFRVALKTIQRLAGGASFSYFSSQVGAFSSDRRCQPTVKFVVHREQISTTTTTATTRKLIPAMPVVANSSSRGVLAKLNGTEVIRLAAFVRSSTPLNCTVYAVWGAARLTQFQPKFPACNPDCEKDLQQGSLPLSCVFGTCPGAAIQADTAPSPFTFVGRVHKRALVCVDCSSSKRRHSEPVLRNVRKLTRAVGAQADSNISFNLSAMKQAGLGSYGVFRAVVGVDNRTLKKCHSQRFNDRGDSLEFRLHLNSRLIRTVRYDSVFPSGEISLFLGQARQLTLITANVGRGGHCNQAIWGEARLEKGLLGPFSRCRQDCAKVLESGRIPLSCFFGSNVCPSTAVRRSNAPFTKVRHTRWGVGIDTAGDWVRRKADRKPILFAGRSSRPFGFGIGLKAPGHVQFNLSAIRAEGFVFNIFQAVVGIDVSSQVSSCRGSLGGEARVYGDNRILRLLRFAHAFADRRYGSNTTAGRRIFVNVTNIQILKLVGRNPFNHRCPHVAFGDASLQLFQMSTHMNKLS